MSDPYDVDRNLIMEIKNIIDEYSCEHTESFERSIIDLLKEYSGININSFEDELNIIHLNPPFPDRIIDCLKKIIKEKENLEKEEIEIITEKYINDNYRKVNNPEYINISFSSEINTKNLNLDEELVLILFYMNSFKDKKYFISSNDLSNNNLTNKLKLYFYCLGYIPIFYKLYM